MTSRPILKSRPRSIDRLGGHVGTSRPAAGARSPQGRGDRQQLCAASHGRTQPARRVDHRRTSRACQSRPDHTGARAAATGGADPTLGAAGLCRLPRVRISPADLAPAFASRAWACGRRISSPLEFTGGLPDDGTGVFRSPLDARQGAWARSPCRAGTEPGGYRATGDPASRSSSAAITGDITRVGHACWTRSIAR